MSSPPQLWRQTERGRTSLERQVLHVVHSKGQVSPPHWKQTPQVPRVVHSKGQVSPPRYEQTPLLQGGPPPPSPPREQVPQPAGGGHTQHGLAIKKTPRTGSHNRGGTWVG
jgi:hypothetical protein